MVNALLKGEELLSEPKTVVVEPVQRFNPERPHSVPVTDGDADDDLYGDMPMRKEKRNPSISKNEAACPPIDKKRQKNGQKETEVPLREAPSLSSGTKKKPAAFTVDPIVDPDAPAKHAKRRPQRKTNRLYEKLRAIGLRTFLIHLLVKWFANGTVVEGMTEEEILRHSVKTVSFRRKVVGTILTAVMIIAMLICIKYM